MRICYLTQTATDISDYYKDFFKEKDLFFITFKSPNPQALAFLPTSTWSDGRNRLWEEVKGKYDYYVFMDDDLQFSNLNRTFSVIPFVSYLYYLLHLTRLYKCYQKSKPAYFFARLTYYLHQYQPEVLSVSQVTRDGNKFVNAATLKRNSFVRRMGYFDAQFTVFSQYAATKVLPYDNKISGWWSSQIPVFLYTFHVFAKKAICVIDLGAINSNWSRGRYTEGYNGNVDCTEMLEAISTATGRDYKTTAGAVTNKKSTVNNTYGKEVILKGTVTPEDKEDYQSNYANSLSGLEKLLHEHMPP